MRTTDTLIIIANALLALTAILGNGLIFYVHYKYESLRKPANSILLSLAATDFLTGAISQPFFIYERLMISASCTAKQVCLIGNIRSFIILFLSGATEFNLSATTLDRYIAIFHGLRYPEIVTNERVTKVLWILWLLWIGCLALTLTPYLSTWLLATSAVCIHVTFISTLNFMIYRELRRARTEPVLANDAEQVRRARERKGVETLAIILGLLFLCYIPIIIFLLFLVVFYLSGKTDTINNEVIIQKYFIISITFPFANSSLNVFVYFWKNSEIRTAIQKVLRPLYQRFQTEVTPVTQQSVQQSVQGRGG